MKFATAIKTIQNLNTVDDVEKALNSLIIDTHESKPKKQTSKSISQQILIDLEGRERVLLVKA